jgi:membrane protein implicated in regulation of membrane protease activity
MFLGKQARVLTDLRKNNIEGGRVLFDGTEWAAVASEDIPAGSAVEIVKMDGLTAHVRPIRE